MSLYYPKKDDYSTDALSNDIIMDKDKFTQNFNHMFPEGRVFLNMKQLRIAVISNIGSFFLRVMVKVSDALTHLLPVPKNNRRL